MSRIIHVLPIVHQDVEEITNQIAKHDLSAALHFVDALEKSYQHLLDYPDSGEVWDNDDRRLSNIRIWPVHKYSNYLIFYRNKRNTIEIARVVHGSREYSELFKE